MIDDTYKGESSAKKLARMELWDFVVPRTPTVGSIVVLASREMGDYSVLSAMGHAGRVLSVDRCLSAVALAKKKYPGADVRHGDVADIIEAETGPIAAVFLDFCAPFGADVAKTVSRVAKALRPGTILCVGILKGREQDSERNARSTGAPFIPNNRHARRFVRSKCGAGGSMACGLGFDARTGLGDYQKRLGLDAGTTRAAMVADVVGRTTEAHLKMLTHIDYQSRTDESNGVPMTYAIYRRTSMRGNAIQGSYEYWQVTREEADAIRSEALSLEESGRDAAGLLNIPRSTITAWKAHASRGTYEAAAE